MKEWERISRKKLGITGAVILAGIVYYMVIKKFGISVPCIFYKMTGLKCPGCGITGMAVYLLQGDILRAVQKNIGLCIISPILVPTIATCWYRWLTNRNNNIRVINVSCTISIVLLILWVIYRNIVGL